MTIDTVTAEEALAGQRMKSQLAARIGDAIRRLKLTQGAAGELMGVSQAKVSGMLRGDYRRISEVKLMECLTRLGYDVEISVRPSEAGVGQVQVSERNP